MSEPYVGEIRIVGFNFAPQGWALCNGQTMSIAENEALFNLIGTTYGGDGVETFNLPNLQSRIPFDQGNSQGTNLILGELSGTETVTVLASQIPTHAHPLAASSAAGTQTRPAGGFCAASPLEEFSTGAPAGAMHPSALLSAGGNQPHDNMPPYLVLNFVISLFGVYPSQG